MSRDPDDVMDMVEQAAMAFNEEPDKDEAPAPRFTHRVVPIEVTEKSRDNEFDREKRVKHETLIDIRNRVRKSATAANLRDLVIGLYHDGPHVYVETETEERAEALLEALLEDEMIRLRPERQEWCTTEAFINECLRHRSQVAVNRALQEDRKKKPITKVSAAVENLESQTRRAVAAIARPTPMRGPETGHQVDELAAALHETAPWLREATKHVWRSMKENVEEGRGPCVKPLLIYGPPGTGKTSLARRLAELTGAASAELDVGAGAAGFRISGTERGWSSSGSGVPVETVLETGCPNPVFVVNELCEAGEGVMSTSGTRTSIVTALLQMLDLESAAKFTCPALRVPFDLSRASWVLTANDIDKVPAHLLSRVRRVYAPTPDAEDVAAIVRKRLVDLDPDLANHAAEVLADKWRKKSRSGSMTLRQVEALCSRVRRAAEAPQLH